MHQALLSIAFFAIFYYLLIFYSHRSDVSYFCFVFLTYAISLKNFIRIEWERELSIWVCRFFFLLCLYQPWWNECFKENTEKWHTQKTYTNSLTHSQRAHYGRENKSRVWNVNYYYSQCFFCVFHCNRYDYFKIEKYIQIMRCKRWMRIRIKNQSQKFPYKCLWIFFVGKKRCKCSLCWCLHHCFTCRYRCKTSTSWYHNAKCSCRQC